jgi:hypothetical protein
VVQNLDISNIMGNPLILDPGCRGSLSLPMVRQMTKNCSLDNRFGFSNDVNLFYRGSELMGKVLLA